MVDTMSFQAPEFYGKLGYRRKGMKGALPVIILKRSCSGPRLNAGEHVRLTALA